MFDVGPAPRIEDLGPPVGWVTAAVGGGLTYGMGFVMWVMDGAIHQLEGSANANEVTSGLDFEGIAFHGVEPREP